MIYADLESLIEKTDWCKNNPVKPFTTKVVEHYFIRYFNVYNFVIKDIEIKHVVWGKDYMKKLYESLREHTNKIIHFKN